MVFLVGGGLFIYFINGAYFSDREIIERRGCFYRICKLGAQDVEATSKSSREIFRGIF